MKTISLLAKAGDEITNPILSKDLQGLLRKSPTAFFSAFIPKLVGMAFLAGSVIFFFVLIVGAIQWISSGGDKAALESARGKISNAIIGIVLLFSAFAVVRFIESFFGINILEIDLGPLFI